MGTGAALLASALITAGSQQISASKQRRTQRNIARQQEEAKRRSDVAEKRTRDQQLEAERVATQLRDTRATDLQNQQLAARDIQQIGDVPSDDFAAITEAVLNDGR